MVNRLQPRFGDQTAADALRAVVAAEADGDAHLASLWRNLAEVRALSDAEEGVIAPLVREVGEPAVHRVPLLVEDVHDLDGLREIARHLFKV